MSGIGPDCLVWKGTLSTTYEQHRFSDGRTGETLLTAIRDSEAEHWGLTPPIVPGLCGDEDKMPERCGQVATAIVQSVTSRLPGLHRKIAAVRVISRKTFLFLRCSVGTSLSRAVRFLVAHDMFRFSFKESRVS